MDKLKIKDLRSLSDAELITKENSLKEELHKLNFQRKMGRVEKPHLFLNTRRAIARIETLLNKKNKSEKVLTELEKDKINV